MAEFAKYIKKSVKIEQDLLQQIHSGELPVGTKLPSEPELAEKFGVSRGSLREALNMLQEKGYISRAKHGGSYIRQKNDDFDAGKLTIQVRTASLKELIEFRETIEAKVVQCVIERASDDDLLALRELLSCEEMPGVENTDYYFHYHLAELSGNPLFVSCFDLCYNQILKFAIASYKSKFRTMLMNEEHKKILDCICQRDKKNAISAMKIHHRNLLARLMEDADIDV